MDIVSTGIVSCKRDRLIWCRLSRTTPSIVTGARCTFGIGRQGCLFWRPDLDKPWLLASRSSQISALKNIETFTFSGSSSWHRMLDFSAILGGNVNVNRKAIVEAQLDMSEGDQLTEWGSPILFVNRMMIVEVQRVSEGDQLSEWGLPLKWWCVYRNTDYVFACSRYVT